MPTSDALGPCSPRPFSSTPPLIRPLAAAHDHVRSRHRVIIIGNTPATNASKPALYKSIKLKWLLLPCCAKTAPVEKMPPRPAFEEEDDVEIIDNDDGLSLSGGSVISWSAAGYEQEPTLPGAIPDPADSRRLRVRALPPLKGTKPLKRCGELPPLEIIGTQLKPLPADRTTTPVQQLVQPMSLPKPAKLSKRQRNKARKRANRARKEQLRLEKKAEALRKAETAKPAATIPKRPKRRIGFRSNAVAPVDDNVAEVEEVNAASISKRISNSPLQQDRSEQKRDLEMFISTGVQGKEAKKLTWAADEDVKQAADDIVVVDVDSDDDVERLLRSASVASEESSRLFTSEFEPDSSFPELFPPVTPDSVSEQALQVEDDAPADRCPSSTTFVVSFGNQRSFRRPTTANRLAVKKTAPMKEELQKKQKMAEIRRMVRCTLSLVMTFFIYMLMGCRLYQKSGNCPHI